MPFCNECGARIPEEKLICDQCGRKWGASGSVKAANNFVPPPPQMNSRTGQILSVGGYIGSFLLLMIPIAGFILCIVWACGGAKNRNRVNMARAYLILSLIGIAISVALYFLLAPLITEATALFQGMMIG